MIIKRPKFCTLLHSYFMYMQNIREYWRHVGSKSNYQRLIIKMIIHFIRRAFYKLPTQCTEERFNKWPIYTVSFSFLLVALFALGFHFMKAIDWVAEFANLVESEAMCRLWTNNELMLHINQYNGGLPHNVRVMVVLLVFNLVAR